ncbi:MAG: ABC transporter permease subunit [Hyphomicrobiales bacterium]
MQRRSSSLLIAVTLGFAFLYGPIVWLVVYSFNESRLATVWSGFSVKWYGALLENEQILNAAYLSLEIAFISASLALVLGTLAAFALVRFKKFRGRLTLSGAVTAPLVMPEVITGLSLLLLFIAMEAAFGWPAGRGKSTIIIAHTTFAMAYIAVVVQSRLVSVDRSIEEAAMDLGARPARVFWDITLPTIMPAMISGWLLAFTLSLDDLVIASFVSGPSSSTLPIVIFSKVRLGVTPEINAVATLLIGAVALGVIVAGVLMWRQEKRLKLAQSQA